MGTVKISTISEAIQITNEWINIMINAERKKDGKSFEEAYYIVYNKIRERSM